MSSFLLNHIRFSLPQSPVCGLVTAPSEAGSLSQKNLPLLVGAAVPGCPAVGCCRFHGGRANTERPGRGVVPRAANQNHNDCRWQSYHDFLSIARAAEHRNPGKGEANTYRNQTPYHSTPRPGDAHCGRLITAPTIGAQPQRGRRGRLPFNEAPTEHPTAKFAVGCFSQLIVARFQEPCQGLVDLLVGKQGGVAPVRGQGLQAQVETVKP